MLYLVSRCWQQGNDGFNPTPLANVRYWSILLVLSSRTEPGKGELWAVSKVKYGTKVFDTSSLSIIRGPNRTLNIFEKAKSYS